MTIEEEKELLERIKDDPQAFGILFDIHYRRIFGYIFRRTADYDLSRDLASETFLKAFFHVKDFEPRGISISFWLYRIATNEINAHYRRLPFFAVSLFTLRDQGIELPDATNFLEERESLEEELAKHEEYLAIVAALKTLSVRYQEVLSLRYFEDKSIKEIAVIVEKPEGTVKSLLSRGIEKLKKRVGVQPNRTPRIQEEERHHGKRRI